MQSTYRLKREKYTYKCMHRHCKTKINNEWMNEWRQSDLRVLSWHCQWTEYCRVTELKPSCYCSSFSDRHMTGNHTSIFKDSLSMISLKRAGRQSEKRKRTIKINILYQELRNVITEGRLPVAKKKDACQTEEKQHKRNLY